MSEEKKHLSIEIDEVTAQGIYSNLAFITHTEQEFVIDFMFLSPQQPKAKVRSRIITSPKHAKRFIGALMENLKKYEARFGSIKPDAAPPQQAGPPMYN